MRVVAYVGCYMSCEDVVSVCYECEDLAFFGVFSGAVAVSHELVAAQVLHDVSEVVEGYFF